MEISERPPFSKKKCVNLMTLMQKQQPIFFFFRCFFVFFSLENWRIAQHKTQGRCTQREKCNLQRSFQRFGLEGWSVLSWSLVWNGFHWPGRMAVPILSNGFFLALMKLRPLTSAAPQAQLPDASFRIHDRLAIEARDITTVPQTPVTTDYAAVKILIKYLKFYLIKPHPFVPKMYRLKISKW